MEDRKRIAGTNLLALIAFFCISTSSQAFALAERVVIKDAGVLGNYGESSYIWAAADLYGSVERDDGTDGSYRVPITMIYPDSPPHQIGFVDIVNAARFQVMREGDPPDRRRSLSYRGLVMLGDFLWRNNYSYLSVIWSKAATDGFGPDYGIIENGTDGYQILSDAAEVLRNPPTLEGTLPFAPSPVKYVIGFGFSQTGSLQWAYEKTGNNVKDDGTLYYDGMLAMVGGRRGRDNCRHLNNDSTPRTHPNFPKNPSYFDGSTCNGMVEPSSKYISLVTETEIDRWGAHMERAQTNNYRQYELAGVAHLYPAIHATGKYGHFHQNPVNHEPAARAALKNLVDWILNDIDPPPSTYIAGEEKDNQFIIKRDTDGNAIGGVRLPHMPSLPSDGRKVGAPLGVYLGVKKDEPSLKKLGPDEPGWNWIMRIISGSFKPFTAVELEKRYPDRAHYVDRVSRAVDLLVEQRFLLPEDRKRYIKEAENLRISVWREG